MTARFVTKKKVELNQKLPFHIMCYPKSKNDLKEKYFIGTLGHIFLFWFQFRTLEVNSSHTLFIAINSYKSCKMKSVNNTGTMWSVRTAQAYKRKSWWFHLCFLIWPELQHIYHSNVVKVKNQHIAKLDTFTAATTPINMSMFWPMATH